MSSKRWLAACTGGASKRQRAEIARFRSNPSGQCLCGRPVTGGLRRCLAGRANPRNSTAIAAVSRAGGRPLASHPANPLSRREEIVNTFYNFCAWARIWATTRSKTRQKAASCVVAKLMRMQVLEPRLAWNMAPGAIM